MSADVNQETPQERDRSDKAPERLFIGVDVGGTKILGVAVEPTTGQVRGSKRVPTPRGDPGSVGPTIAGVVDELIEAHGPPAAVGVGVPGLVDHEGVLHYGPNVPGVFDLDIAGDLRRALNLPVVADNDAANAALAEHRIGAARGAMHAVIITQGTGIGGALIIGGKLLRGANGFAGEPGHMLIDQAGHLCACGRRGCWETVSSGAGLANLSRDLIEEGRGQRILELAGGEPAHIRGEHVSAAMAEGDDDAEEVLEKFSTWVARGIGSLITLLDPELVVLGGGLAVINQHFLSDVRSKVPAAVLGGQYRPTVPIVAASLGEEAGAIGAAINARDLFLAH